MIGSVRSRLTAAVVVTVGALGVAAALIAPRTVHNALVDDRLDAEVVHQVDALEPGFAVVAIGDDGTIGSPELTALFGPQIVSLTEALDESGALNRLRSFDHLDRLHVSPIGDVVGTVEPSGQVRVDHVTHGRAAGPLVTTSQLEQLADELNGTTGYGDPFNIFSDQDLTFEEFIASLDAQFGPLIEGRLDSSVFEEFPPFDFGDGEIPRGVFDILQNDLLPAAPRADAAPAAQLEDYVFGVRSADGVDVIVSASADGIQRSVDRVRDVLWMSLPIVMLLAGALTWLLAGRALRPVRAITRQTGQIRSSTLHERVPVPHSHDEVAALATEMNTMLDRVQREDGRRRQFVADASHELRSPIAAIRTQAESVLSTTDDIETAELATGVLAEAERMGTLVDDLLSLARHDEELAPPGVVLDLDDIVLADADRPRSVPVDVSAVSAGRVLGRPDELTRVVTHLLDNATRHAERRVVVSLDTVPSDNENDNDNDNDTIVRLTVDDDGPGIPIDQRERVFERFVRLDEARERDSGGAGLGLAVVASVVAAAGGRVSAESSDLGGARFQVELPAAD